MKKKYGVGMVAMTCLAGTAMITAASHTMFTADNQTPVQYMKAGTLQITSTVEAANVCGSSRSSVTPNSNLNMEVSPGPGKKSTGELLVHNTGTLTAWVGLINELSGSGNFDVSYTVQVYESDPRVDDSNDPDSNGDIHGNCHTGSQRNATSGNDRSTHPKATDVPIETGRYTHVPKTAVVPGDRDVHTPFRLPVGDYALVTYQFSQARGHRASQLGSNADDSATLSVAVEAVQYRHHANPFHMPR